MITVHTCRRRSWDEPPPPMDKDSPHWPGRDDRYRQLGKYVRTCVPLFCFLSWLRGRSSYFFFIFVQGFWIRFRYLNLWKMSQRGTFSSVRYLLSHINLYWYAAWYRLFMYQIPKNVINQNEKKCFLCYFSSILHFVPRPSSLTFYHIVLLINLISCLIN